jgi:putative membrane protein
MERGEIERSVEPLLLLSLAAIATAVSAISPHDRTTWWLEAFPVIVAAPLLAFTALRFPLTRLAYRLIFLHAIVLLVGAHWTYARVPLGEWAREWFGWQRNHYDRLGHFAQGFVPAIVARELLIRMRVVASRRWLVVVVTAIALALSACYELVEWVAALLLGKGAEDFLGTQGDPWDTQCDMALALAGALLAQMLLARWHDAQIAITRPAARP